MAYYIHSWLTRIDNNSDDVNVFSYYLLTRLCRSASCSEVIPKLGYRVIGDWLSEGNQLNLNKIKLQE